MGSGRTGLRYVFAVVGMDETVDSGAKLISGQPLWAKLFYLVRTGHLREALEEAFRYQQAIEHREASFLSHFRTWVESSDRR